MCFNAPISNPDDHPRNHAIIAWDRDWKLSPAYDLTPMSLIGLEWRDLAMMCGDAGRAAAATNPIALRPLFHQYARSREDSSGDGLQHRAMLVLYCAWRSRISCGGVCPMNLNPAVG
jgi:hypothetical protein